jgi:hypothetical protein
MAADRAADLVMPGFGAFIVEMPPGIVIERPSDETSQTCESSLVESCDFCGSGQLEWRKCKLICADCKQINKSCADL